MLYYKMNSQTILMCVVALILGMLLANMLKSVCGCKVVEGADRIEALGRLDNILEEAGWRDYKYYAAELGSEYGCSLTWHPDKGWYDACTAAQNIANYRPPAIGPNCHAIDAAFGGCHR